MLKESLFLPYFLRHKFLKMILKLVPLGTTGG